jgi:hypothetical protein
MAALRLRFRFLNLHYEAAATILSARKLIDRIESDKPNFAKEYFVDKAINEAAFVLERIDRKWPSTG